MDNDTEVVNITSCAQFLYYNLTLDDVATSTSIDSCGFPILNATIIKYHPARYAYIVLYPIFLFICTVGNFLTIFVLTRERIRSVKWIFLVALATCDLITLWSQFFPYFAEFDSIPEGTPFYNFLLGIAGANQFTQEMFITASDWVLVAYSVERFVAVTFPVWYNLVSSSLSKTSRAAVTISAILLLALLYALIHLVNYYWVYFNDDKRCPAEFILLPNFLKTWYNVNLWLQLIVPILTFAAIVTLNVVVIIRVFSHREFQRQHAHEFRGKCGAQDCQAIRMLLASVIVYAVTQFPSVVYGCLTVAHQYPNCAFQFTESSDAILSRTKECLVVMNYSINFILYSLVSTNFRSILRESFTGKPKPKHVQWLHALSLKKSKPKDEVHTVDNEDPSASGEKRVSMSSTSSSDGTVSETISDSARGSLDLGSNHGDLQIHTNGNPEEV